MLSNQHQVIEPGICVVLRRGTGVARCRYRPRKVSKNINRAPSHFYRWDHNLEISNEQMFSGLPCKPSN